MSIFTRRHYVWIERQFALSLHDCADDAQRDEVWDVIYDFAHGLSEQSSQFDKDLFCQAILDEFRNLQANYNHDYPPQPLTKAGT